MRASVTRAAVGFDRRSFPVDDVLRTQEAVFVPAGDIFAMRARTHLNALFERRPEDALLATPRPDFSPKLAGV